MRIGELAKATGVDVETIRYYEKAQLLSAPTRSDNGYRAYTQTHLERLAFIRHCRALDIPLADVQRLLSFVDHPQTDCGEIDLLIETQLAKVRTRLASMQALERQLNHGYTRFYTNLLKWMKESGIKSITEEEMIREYNPPDLFS